MSAPLSPQRWQDVKSAFFGAVELSGAERDRFLAEQCRDDDALRAEVESLLTASARQDGALGNFAPPTAPNDLRKQLDALLGPRYEIQDELGGGGMSRVFLAKERAFAREVVIKVLSPERAHRISLERFDREVRVSARLQQANIVPVLTAGEVGGLPYYVMPYVRGESLRERLRVGPLRPSEALSILRDVAKALAAAHREGIVHRDIKPENIMLSGGTAVVLDFGIAKAISFAEEGSSAPREGESTVTGVGISLGTPAYMSPEQILRDRVGAPADVYAFGIVAYETLASAHPFAGKSTMQQILAAHISEIPRPLDEVRSGLPRWLTTLVMRCLAKTPQQRPENGAALLVALESGEPDEVATSARDDDASARSSQRVVHPEAFELYLRGRNLVEQRTDGMREALRCFEKAIELDPGFSAPHAAIGLTFTTFGIYHALRPRDAFPRAREAAERALALDPWDALALVVRAHVMLWYEWDFGEAEQLARRAVALADGLYLAHDCLGWILAAQGKFEEAVATMQRARELDPLSTYATYDLAWVLILAGRWDEALRELQPAVARHPFASELLRTLGFCLFYTGKQQEARAQFERVLELNAGDRWGRANLVQVLGALGESVEGHRHAQAMEERASHEPVPLTGIAIMHHWLGDDDAALRWLEKAVDARDYWLVMLRFDPSMIRLRNDARFQSILRQVSVGASDTARSVTGTI